MLVYFQPDGTSLSSHLQIMNIMQVLNSLRAKILHSFHWHLPAWHSKAGHKDVQRLGMQDVSLRLGSAVYARSRRRKLLAERVSNLPVTAQPLQPGRLGAFQ